MHLGSLQTTHKNSWFISVCDISSCEGPHPYTSTNPRATTINAQPSNRQEKVIWPMIEGFLKTCFMAMHNEAPIDPSLRFPHSKNTEHQLLTLVYLTRTLIILMLWWSLNLLWLTRARDCGHNGSSSLCPVAVKKEKLIPGIIRGELRTKQSVSYYADTCSDCIQNNVYSAACYIWKRIS